MAADGASNSLIAQKLDLSQQTVCLWRKRYLQHGIQGLHDELKPGRPRTISDERVAALVKKTLQTKPKHGTHWSVRTIAEGTRLSHMTVHRIWRAFGLQPHRQRHFKLSTDAFFVEKVRTLSDSTSVLLRTPLCCASTRRARSRPWSARSRCYPWV